MTGGYAMNAKITRTGKSQNANRQSASLLERVLKTSLETYHMRPQRRRSPEEVHAQLILIIGTTLAFVFLIVTVGITYALIFVTQPIGNQAPNDAAFIDLLKTLAIFLTGSLGGVLAGNGLKSKPKPPVDTPTATRES
jgi:high-affinity K+ transport system ATPase subunit B